MAKQKIKIPEKKTPKVEKAQSYFDKILETAEKRDEITDLLLPKIISIEPRTFVEESCKAASIKPPSKNEGHARKILELQYKILRFDLVDNKYGCDAKLGRITLLALIKRFPELKQYYKPYQERQAFIKREKLPKAKLTKAPHPSVKLAKAPSISENPEELQQKAIQHTFNIPRTTLYGSTLIPKNKEKFKGKRPKLFVYFPGRGSYKAFLKWHRRHPGKTPPLDIVAAAAREDFLSSRKRLFAWVKSEWAKGNYVVPVMVFPSRQRLGRLRRWRLRRKDKNDKRLKQSDTGLAATALVWYNEFYTSKTTNRIIGLIKNKVKQYTNRQPLNDITFAGASMGGLAVKRLARLARKGKLEGKHSFINFDATYFGGSDLENRAKNGDPLVITFIPKTKTNNSKTAKYAMYVIRKLKLKRQKIGNTVIYTSERYPNVKVIQAKTAHGKHPGTYIADAWKHTQKFQARV